MTDTNELKTERCSGLSDLTVRLADRPAKHSMTYAPGWERRNDTDNGIIFWKMWTHKGLEILQYQVAISYAELKNGGACIVANKLRRARHALRRAKAANA